tara:strand:+ start:390 stop:704 length:315 start_codon:yes stop_codon:yes gene_type:complete
MNNQFRSKWIKLINSATEQKCRTFLSRLKKQPIEVPFTSKQKFVFMLIKTRLRYLAQKENPNKKVIRLPRADATDLNWTSPRSINNRQVQEYLLTKEKRNDKTR